MKKTLAVLLMTCGMLSAQTPAQERRENSDRSAAGLTPIYRVTVTERTTKAISYRNRSGATKIDFAGTALMPAAHGEAKVESKKGYIEIEVEFRNLTEATPFGAEYLTYVLWAITPEGRTSNLGEILRNGTSGKLDVTTELQAFALVVTAEPYFAVSRPSDVVVMENIVRPDTVGKIELIDAKYELLQRGQYEHLANVLDLRVNRKMPLELYEARNAIQIARTSGADRFATETFKKAEADLQQAETYRARNAGIKPVTMTARHAVQTAEDARAIAVKRQDDDLLALERQATADRQATAENGRTAAELETNRVTREAAEARRRAENDAARLKSANDTQSAEASAEADRLRRDNDLQRAAALAEADRLKRDNDAQREAALNQADLLKRNNDAQRASALSEADRLKLESDAKLAAAQSDLDRAARDRTQAETEKTELRAKLLLQFNAILQTRDTARGLIVNLSDVLFDTAKFSLRPEAREKLAKVAGIVSGHPGLRLDVEGHTDNVGGDDYNQNLSEQRGSSVRDYLTQQGMAQGSVSTRGFGKTQPIASNDTAAGRQQNRRVELVISGEIIGVEIGVPLALK
ncbi:MAG: OmpA family protein [Acidobacteriota bacterium]|nr:OmpA family protein [Acidobacteriota bacterium]